MSDAVEGATRGEVCATVLKETLRPVFQQVGDHVVASYLYGSQATGKAGDCSDVNVAVLVDEKAWEAGHDPRHEIRTRCCTVLERDDVEVVVMNDTGNLLLLEEITNRGIVLHDRKPEVRSAFEEKVLHDYLDCRKHRVNHLWD